MSRKRADISARLLDLRRRVLYEGQQFYRVFSPGSVPRDFGRRPRDFDEFAYATAGDAAKEYALELASLSVGSSVFISERRELDGVQVLVHTREVSFSFLGGLDPCP